MSKHPPRRLTPAESDALVAYLTPVERRRAIDHFIEAMAIRGIVVRETFDAAGRSYLATDLDQVRAVSPDLAALFEEVATYQPEPQGHRFPAA